MYSWTLATRTWTGRSRNGKGRMTTSADTAVSEGRSIPVTESRFLLPFMLITSLFFLWAFGVNLNDILIPHLKKAFGLSDF